MRAIIGHFIVATLAGFCTAQSLKPFQVREAILATNSSTFHCPEGTTYAPWTRCCSCPPGQLYNKTQSKCLGDKIDGPWPKPDLDNFKADEQDGVELASFCAYTPVNFVQYDPDHPFCQASINTITFVANADIEAEVKAYNGEDIDPTKLGTSKEIRNVCKGLSGIYLKDVNDAVDLFSTNKHGLGKLLHGVGCAIGLGKHCYHDCVGYCEPGCKNYLGDILGDITGLVGFCVLPGVLKLVDGLGHVLCASVDKLMCLLMGVLKELSSIFHCNCN